MFDSQQSIYTHQHPDIDFSKWQELADLISEIYGAACGTIVQFNQQQFNVVVASKNIDNFLNQGDHWSWEQPSFCRHMLETQQDLYVDNALKSSLFSGFPAVTKGPVRSYAGVPIFWPNGEPFGTICAIDIKPTQYNAQLTKLLAHLARLIAADLKIIAKIQMLAEVAITDPATNTYNRRGFYELGNQKIQDAFRHQAKVGLLYLDINKLKKVNDNHGHEAGDKLIKGLADTLIEQCRQNDIITRLGGDEFAVLATVCDEQELEKLANRIKDRFNEFLASDPQLSISGVKIGWYLNSDFTITDLDIILKEADYAMYKQKFNQLH